MPEDQPTAADVSASADDLPICVLTYRRGPNGVEHLHAIIQSNEDEAHQAAEALCRTGQPTWLFVLDAHEQQRYRPEHLNGAGVDG